jgi:hypothetical protein
VSPELHKPAVFDVQHPVGRALHRQVVRAAEIGADSVNREDYGDSPLPLHGDGASKVGSVEYLVEV